MMLWVLANSEVLVRTGEMRIMRRKGQKRGNIEEFTTVVSFKFVYNQKNHVVEIEMVGES